MCAVDKELVAKIENKGKCKDNFCGTIENIINAKNLHFTLDKRNLFLERNKIDENVKSEGFRNIVIVLESPHKDEYINEYQFIAPALGKTGDNLQGQFIPVLKNTLANLGTVNYNVFLVNAVQYQCSNGDVLTSKNREINPNRLRTDSIWEWFWEKGGSEDFKRRINLVLPYMVINACTGNINDENSIKNKLQKSINECCDNECCDNVKLFKTPHPSSDHFKEGCLSEV